MILYHGTSTKYLKSILKNGLLPRVKTGNSNWEGAVESKPEFVYLTTAYPVYFALATAEKTKSDLLILQVEVEEKDLYPDEDFVALFMHRNFPRFKNMPLNEVNPHVDMETHRFMAKDSLELNGKVAVKKVGASNIKNHVVLKRNRDFGAIMSLGGDSVPVPIAYKILGQRYVRCLAALFEGGVDAAMQTCKLEWSEMYGSQAVSILMGDKQ